MEETDRKGYIISKKNHFPGRYEDSMILQAGHLLLPLLLLIVCQDALPVIGISVIDLAMCNVL